MMRVMLYEAAQIMLTHTNKWSWLKAWAMKIARHRGMKKAQDRRYKKKKKKPTDSEEKNKGNAFEGLPTGGPFRIECRCAMSA